MAAKDKIKIVRMINGEELLGEYVGEELYGESADRINIVPFKNLVRIVVVPSRADPTTPSVAFAPFCQFSNQDRYDLYRTSIVTIINPIDEFIDQYNSLFSRIIQPSAATQTPSKLIGI